MTVGSEIRPSESVRVTPTLSYFDYGPAVNKDALARVALGLDLELFSSSEGWALSTALQYPLTRYASTRSGEFSDRHDIDFSLTFSQRLTDHVRLSLTGKNISYGQMGISNVKKFKDIFRDCCIISNNIEELIDKALSLPKTEYLDMVSQQQMIVQMQHTYVNRYLNIIRAFESIE